MQAILYSSNFRLQQFSPPAIIFLEIFSQAIFVARNFLDKELFFPQLFSGNFQSRNYFMPIFMQSWKLREEQKEFSIKWSVRAEREYWYPNNDIIFNRIA